ncbi:MAG: hypothetical protein AAFO91_20260, partial [Bacteroidota bacterium]
KTVGKPDTEVTQQNITKQDSTAVTSSVNTVSICKSQNKTKKSKKSKKRKKVKSKASEPNISAPILEPAKTNRPAPVTKPSAKPDQTGILAGSQGDAVDGITWPPRRKLPDLPPGPITQQIGKEWCQKYCDVYFEVFDDTTEGCFKGATVTLDLKPGGLEAITNSGPRPVVKPPFGLEEQFFEKLKKLYKNLTPIDGKDLITASQIVPVISTDKNGERKIDRLAINYKSTINEYIKDIPDLYTTCTDELAKVAGEYRTTVDLQGAFNQVPANDMLIRKLLAVVTPWGYAIPDCLMFGVKTAPAIFNSNMRKLLHACNGKGPVNCAQMVDDVCLS